jgi:hypothetical protein
MIMMFITTKAFECFTPYVNYKKYGYANAFIPAVNALNYTHNSAYRIFLYDRAR